SSHDTSGPTVPPTFPPASPNVVSSTPPVVAPSSEPTASPTPMVPIPSTDSTFTYKAPLEYPQIALQQNIEGTVVVLVTIGPTGELVSASIASSSGNAALDEAALAAARSSRYSPYIANGSPVTQQYKIVYEFRLNQ
ncbi:MAG TPA: TonB family protein, partial [Candidatus Eremiobacteraceae bacterium]|nr:TonB family protein [Candidatus Eremiobacteraceae bacterium]